MCKDFNFVNISFPGDYLIIKVFCATCIHQFVWHQLLCHTSSPIILVLRSINPTYLQCMKLLHNDSFKHIKYVTAVFEVRRTRIWCPSLLSNRLGVVVCHCFPRRFTSLLIICDMLSGHGRSLTLKNVRSSSRSDLVRWLCLNYAKTKENVL